MGPASTAGVHVDRGRFVVATVVADLAHGALVSSFVGEQTYRSSNTTTNLMISPTSVCLVFLWMIR